MISEENGRHLNIAYISCCNKVSKQQLLTYFYQAGQCCDEMNHLFGKFKQDKARLKSSTLEKKSIWCCSLLFHKDALRWKDWVCNRGRGAPSVPEVRLHDCSTRLQAATDRVLLGRRQLMKGLTALLSGAGEYRGRIME